MDSKNLKKYTRVEERDGTMAVLILLAERIESENKGAP